MELWFKTGNVAEEENQKALLTANTKRRYQKTTRQLLQALHLRDLFQKVHISKLEVVKYDSNHGPNCGSFLSAPNLRESTPGLLFDKTVNLEVIDVHLLKT